MTQNKSTEFAEKLGLIVGIALVVCMVFTTVAPYFLAIPTSSVRLIDQQQTILQSLFLVLVGYLWGNSAGNKAKDSIIEQQAKQNTALMPEVVGETIPLAPGEQATIRAEDP